jgi:hypothetical protein
MDDKYEPCNCDQPLNYLVADFCERCHRELKPREVQDGSNG